ncbi:MAG: bifunctional protein HldE [bacterium]|nr:MAG: bifunctional protein HldE [bacterium]
MPERELYKQFKDIKPVRIAVIGDVILDEYIAGEISRISPEAPVGVLDCSSEEYRLGGAANVAVTLEMLGGIPALIGVTGDDQDAKVVRSLLQRNGINPNGLVAADDRPTTKKSRILSHRQQLLRIDREKREPVQAKTEKQILVLFKKLLPSLDGVILSDYNKGLLTKSLLKEVITLCRRSGKPMIIDPKGDSYLKYRGADIITPNLKELEKATGIACSGAKRVEKAARLLMKKCSIKTVLATLGKDGMALFTKNGEGMFLTTVAKEVFDVTGAGDTVVAVFASGLLGGLNLEAAARLANLAGGLQVAHLGAAGVGRDEIERSLAGAAGYMESKIVGLKEAAAIAADLRRRNKKVVFTNGCFDLVHFGHIQYLRKAKNLGHRLFLGLNSDSSVKKLKGSGRPLLNEHDRSNILAALDCVDSVIIFGEKTPLKLIRAIKPDILVKGGDYEIDQIVGHGEVVQWGGRTATIPYIKGNSTTGIIQKIVRSHHK